MSDRSISWETHPDPEARLPQGKAYVFAVAIDRYEHLPALSNAVADAQAMLDTLLARYQFRVDHSFTLFDEQATRRAIIARFEALVSLIQPTDVLLVYFSGHGEYSRLRRRGYWIPVDGHPKDPSSFIDNSSIRDYLHDINSRHTLLVSDSCYAGSFFRQTRSAEAEAAPAGDQAYYRKVENYPSRWGLMSGGIEKVSDGQTGTSSPFNRGLIHCLRYNLEPQLSVLELITQVQKAVGNNAKQQPIGNRIFGVNDAGLGQFVFHLNPALVPSEVATASTAPPQTAWVAALSEAVSAQQQRETLSLEEVQAAQQLVNDLLAACGPGSAFPAGLLPRLHGSLKPGERLDPQLEGRSWHRACERAARYARPVVFTQVKLTGRDLGPGREFVLYLKPLSGSGMPGFVRVFFPDASPVPCLSGLAL